MSLDQIILNELFKCDKIDSLNFAAERDIDHQKIVGAIKSLLALPGNYIEVICASLFSINTGKTA